MFKKAIFFTVLTFSSTIFSCDNIPLVKGKRSDGTTAKLIIKTKQFEETKSWDPLNSSPPLSIEEAIEVFKSHNSNKKINYIRLNSYSCYKTSGKWYYVIYYSNIIDGEEVFDIGNWFAVLFDKSFYTPIYTK